MLRTISRYYYTLKYLKPKQFFGRLYTFIPSILRYDTRTPDSSNSFPYNFPSVTINYTNDYKNFTFLNETNDLYEIGWDNANVTKLWRYNLHYFNFLMQDDDFDSIEQKLNLIHYWIDTNPFGKGTAWEPYPTSVRIINWIKWDVNTKQLSLKAKNSLWNQVRWLNTKYEYHLLGNHLFINAKAILFACCYFQFKSDSKLYTKAVSILKNELNEQFLRDGAHFELSPMYHALGMEDLLDLISISSKMPVSFPSDLMKVKFQNGMEWLNSMIYRNLELSHFNDSANGIALDFQKLLFYSENIGLKQTQFANNLFKYFSDSGFVVCLNDNFHLIADIGNIGPDYLPGHAHADCLSFELSLKNHRVFVNSGTSVYGLSSERIWQRGTLAHNTVQIQNSDSSEVWSGFRVARRARPFNINIDELDNNTLKAKFSSSHDGYLRLDSPSIHSRSWFLDKNSLFVEDDISGESNLAIARYYLHPEISVSKENDVYKLKYQELDLAVVTFDSQDEVEILTTTYHDKFGVVKSNLCFEIKKLSPCTFSLKVMFS